VDCYIARIKTRQQKTSDVITAVKMPLEANKLVSYLHVPGVARVHTGPCFVSESQTCTGDVGGCPPLH
jgi:hypothetical protein